MYLLDYYASFGYYLSIHENRWLRRLTWFTADEQFKYVTNPHHTADKNGVYLKITIFSCIKLYIFLSYFLLKILDHVMQINSKVIKSFYV